MGSSRDTRDTNNDGGARYGKWRVRDGLALVEGKQTPILATAARAQAENFLTRDPRLGEHGAGTRELRDTDTSTF